MTYSIYKCDLIKLGCTPQNEVKVASGFATASEAMEAANAMKRADRANSYMITYAENKLEMALEC